MNVVNLTQKREEIDPTSAIRGLFGVLGFLLTPVGVGLMFGIGAAITTAGVILLSLTFYDPFWRT